MKQAQKNVRDYLAEIGRRGGLNSRRELTRSHGKQMVAIREAKRTALKAGKGVAAAQSQIVKAHLNRTNPVWKHVEFLNPNALSPYPRIKQLKYSYGNDQPTPTAAPSRRSFGRRS